MVSYLITTFLSLRMKYEKLFPLLTVRLDYKKGFEARGMYAIDYEGTREELRLG